MHWKSNSAIDKELHIIQISPELIWVFISNKRKRYDRNFALEGIVQFHCSLKEKQPHLQDLRTTKSRQKPPPLCSEGFIPKLKFQCISLSQQNLMSLLRASPGERAVRGNYLCLPKHRTMLSFLLHRKYCICRFEGTLQYSAIKIGVFSYTVLT